ncbi:MAG TPA: SAM-dependent methyltransferase [Pseudonocardiaceae bacterium]|nr:SAM-dependent methyltransferase [Pseudonocardiaceae bacterium]
MTTSFPRDESPESPFGELPTLDMSTVSAARAYDYMLGGHHNFEVDREFAEQVMRAAPQAALVARTNRAWLRRAVRYLLDQGVRQFLDLGSGIPTVGNTHQIAQAAGIQARTVYVDREGVAYHQARQLLAREGAGDQAGIIQADLRDVAGVLGHPEVARLLDFTRPVGLVLASVLLYVSDEDDPAGIISAYLDAMAPGSYLAISTTTQDGVASDLRSRAQDVQHLYKQAKEPVVARSWDQIAAWFARTELVEPGLVELADWRPDPDEQPVPAATRTFVYAGVGRLLPRNG